MGYVRAGDFAWLLNLPYNGRTNLLGARPFGQRILSPVIAVLPNLTKIYEPVFTRLNDRQRITSAGLVSTRTVTILAPFSSGVVIRCCDHGTAVLIGIANAVINLFYAADRIRSSPL